MKRISEGNLTSASEQAKIDKQKVNRTSEPNDSDGIGSFDFSDGSGCGLKNPCVFGKHSKI